MKSYETENITTDTMDMQNDKTPSHTTICQQLDNLEEMDTFLASYSLPRLNYEETKYMNRSIKVRILSE